MTEYTRLGPGGYPVAFQTATPTEITGVVTSSQVQTTAARGRTKGTFQGAPSPGRREDVWVYEISGQATSAQVQTTAAEVTLTAPEKPKPPKPKQPQIRARARSGQAGQVSVSAADVLDPVLGKVRSRSHGQSTAGVIELAHEAVARSRSGSTSRGVGISEQWTDEEQALVLLLLAA